MCTATRLPETSLPRAITRPATLSAKRGTRAGLQDGCKKKREPVPDGADSPKRREEGPL